MTGDDGPNRLEAGPATTTSRAGPAAGRRGLRRAGGDKCQGFGETSSCNDASHPRRRPRSNSAGARRGQPRHRRARRRQPDHRLLHGSAFVVTDPTGVEAAKDRAAPASGAPRAPGRNEPSRARHDRDLPLGIGVNFVLVDSGGGNDTVSVGGGIPGSLQVRVSGGNGNDTINGGPGNDLLEAGDEYSGTSGQDVLNGGPGNDGLVADPGGDQLSGGDGNDLLVSSSEVCQGHRFDGGGGLDTVSYARSKPAGTFTMTLGRTGAPDSGGGAARRIRSSLATRASRVRKAPETTRWSGTSSNNTLLGHGGARQVLRAGRQRLDRSDRRPAGQGDRLRGRRATRARRADVVRPEAEELLRARKPSSPTSGTNLQGPISSLSSRSACRRITVSMSPSRPAIGDAPAAPLGELGRAAAAAGPARRRGRRSPRRAPAPAARGCRRRRSPRPSRLRAAAIVSRAPPAPATGSARG